MPNERTNTTQKMRKGFAAICARSLAELLCEEHASEENGQQRSLNALTNEGALCASKMNGRNSAARSAAGAYAN